MMNDSPDSEPAKSSPDLLVVVATYNEIENLPRLVDEILGKLPECHLLVIDDNSPDGTGRWCNIRMETESRLQCLHREGKLGLGSATVAGMNWAIEHGYRYMISMDADFSHHPDHLPKIYQILSDDTGDYDVVIGSRYVTDGQISGWPMHRRVMSRCVNWYARCLLGLPLKDCSGAFRGYRVEILAELPPAAIECKGYAYLEEILWRLKRQRATFAETPIHFRDRTEGKTKINGREALTALYQILRFGIKNWTTRRPSVP